MQYLSRQTVHLHDSCLVEWWKCRIIYAEFVAACLSARIMIPNSATRRWNSLVRPSFRQSGGIGKYLRLGIQMIENIVLFGFINSGVYNIGIIGDATAGVKEF